MTNREAVEEARKAWLEFLLAWWKARQDFKRACQEALDRLRM